MSFKRALLKATYDIAKGIGYVIGSMLLMLLSLFLIVYAVINIPILLFHISVWLMGVYILILVIFIYACVLYHDASKEAEKDDW